VSFSYGRSSLAAVYKIKMDVLKPEYSYALGTVAILTAYAAYTINID